MQKILWLIAFIFCMSSLHAQVKKKIKRGRRNKSDNEISIPSNYIQAEWEFGHENITQYLATTVYPNMVLRYGITDKMDVSTEFNLITTHLKLPDTTLHTNGIEPVLFGINYLFWSTKDGKSSLIGEAQLAFPSLASKDYTAKHIAPTVQLSGTRSIGKRSQIIITAGVFWDGFSTTPSTTYNSAYSFDITRKWNISSSLFGFIGKSAPLHNLDVSLSYAPNQNFQVGITGGLGINESAHDNYLAVNGVFGFSTKHH
ncbi:MAG TPA: transporter [Chitinophagaceae bacterium]|nr:transporter [Chitinophagaceae bacterium]